MKIRVTLIREYEIDEDPEYLADEYGIDDIESIDDMEVLDELEELSRVMTTWVVPGTVEVVEKEKYKCDECGLVMSLYDDEIGPCPGCGRESYKPTEESNPYSSIDLLGQG